MIISMINDDIQENGNILNSYNDRDTMENIKPTLKLPKEILDIMELDKKIENNEMTENDGRYKNKLNKETSVDDDFFVNDILEEDNKNIYTFSGEDESLAIKSNPSMNQEEDSYALDNVSQNTNFYQGNTQNNNTQSSSIAYGPVSSTSNLGSLLEKNFLLSVENTIKEILPNMNVIIGNVVEKVVQEYLEKNQEKIQEIILTNLQQKYKNQPLEDVIKNQVQSILRENITIKMDVN